MTARNDYLRGYPNVQLPGRFLSITERRDVVDIAERRGASYAEAEAALRRFAPAYSTAPDIHADAAARADLLILMTTVRVDSPEVPRV